MNKLLLTLALIIISIVSYSQSFIGKTENYFRMYIGESQFIKTGDTISFKIEDITVKCVIDSSHRCREYHLEYELSQYDEVVRNLDKNNKRNGSYWISGNHQNKLTISKKDKVIVKVEKYL